MRTGEAKWVLLAWKRSIRGHFTNFWNSFMIKLSRLRLLKPSDKETAPLQHIGRNCPCLSKPRTTEIEPSSLLDSNPNTKSTWKLRCELKHREMALCRTMLSNDSPPPLQFLGLILKMNIKNKRTVFILLTFLKSNSNSILLKKKADWVAYLSQKNSVWFRKCKTITGLEATGKKKSSSFCSFCCCFFNIQIANAFVIHMLNIGIITPCTDSPSETLVAALWHGRESQGTESWPHIMMEDWPCHRNGAEWTHVGDAQREYNQARSTYLWFCKTNKSVSYIFVHKVSTYNAESAQERNQLNRIFFVAVILWWLLWRTKRERKA